MNTIMQQGFIIFIYIIYIISTCETILLESHMVKC